MISSFGRDRVVSLHNHRASDDAAYWVSQCASWYEKEQAMTPIQNQAKRESRFCPAVGSASHIGLRRFGGQPGGSALTSGLLVQSDLNH
jgi:hypothetical protein